METRALRSLASLLSFGSSREAQLCDAASSRGDVDGVEGGESGK